ncbi:MAG: TRAP transporter large permease subunit [Alphaproteobacteria bacterium]|nr:TRAP transporter large permease subunit [Alphaproteobacteria bacterium]
MEYSGIAMLLAVPVLLVATGLPAYLVLIGISVVAAAAGLAMGAFGTSLLSALPGRVVGILENDLLQAIPLFVLMGALLNRLPLADLLFSAARSIARRTPAASRLAGFALGALLAPMNGSVGASAATLTRVVTPKLRAQGESIETGQSLVCVASTLGIVVPPSLVLILLGDAMLRAHTEALNVVPRRMRIVNTQDIFHGALLPAAIFMVMSFVIIWWQGRRDKPAAIAAARPSELAVAGVTLACVGGLLAGIAAGYIYAVEAAAIGTFALFVGGVASGRLGWSALAAVLRQTMVTTGALFALFLAATGFTLVFRMYDTPTLIARAFAALPGGEIGPVAAGLATIGAFAFVLDAFEIIFVIIPILMPPLLQRVTDASWVSILTLLALQASFLVPPFGYSTILARSLSPEPVSASGLARRLLPFLAAQLVVLMAVFVFPPMVHPDGKTLEQGLPVLPSDDELRDTIEMISPDEVPDNSDLLPPDDQTDENADKPAGEKDDDSGEKTDDEDSGDSSEEN